MTNLKLESSEPNATELQCVEDAKPENTGWVDKDEHHKKKDPPNKRVRKPKTK